MGQLEKSLNKLLKRQEQLLHLDLLPLLLLPLHLRMMSPYIMLPLLSMLVVLDKLLLYLLLLD